MKKTLVVLALVMGLSLTAVALPPVTYDPSGTCALSMENSFMFDVWIGILRLADADELIVALYSNPEVLLDDDDENDDTAVPRAFGDVDMELIAIGEGGPVPIIATPGDGVADFAQTALLSSAICADAGLEDQFDANLALVDQLLVDLDAIGDWAKGADIQKVKPFGAAMLNTLYHLVGNGSPADGDDPDTLPDDPDYVSSYLVELGTFAAALGAVPGMAGTAGALATAAGQIGDGIEALAPAALGIGLFAAELLPVMDSSLPGLVGPLGTVKNTISMEAGLSTEMKTTLELLLASLVEELTQRNEDLPGSEDPDGATPAEFMVYLGGVMVAMNAQISGGFGALAAALAAPTAGLADQLTALAAGLTGAGQTELAASATALAARSAAIGGFANTAATNFAANYAAVAAQMPVGAPLLGVPQTPSFTVYGAEGPQMAGEPFSGAGDYDGDGVTNAESWAGVVGAGGTVEDFVAGASGADQFYPGNPLMPAAGLLGLAALVSAIAGGGAFVLRKK